MWYMGHSLFRIIYSLEMTMMIMRIVAGLPVTIWYNQTRSAFLLVSTLEESCESMRERERYVLLQHVPLHLDTEAWAETGPPMATTTTTTTTTTKTTWHCDRTHLVSICASLANLYSVVVVVIVYLSHTTCWAFFPRSFFLLSVEELKTDLDLSSLVSVSVSLYL